MQNIAKNPKKWLLYDSDPCIWWCIYTKGSTEKEKIQVLWLGFLAEKERFELSNCVWQLRDFQSRALDQLRDFSVYFSRCCLTTYILYHNKHILSIGFAKLFAFFEIYFLSCFRRSKYLSFLTKNSQKHLQFLWHYVIMN